MSAQVSDKTLFLVDDDVDLLRAYVDVLREEGINVRGISDPKEALDILTAGPLPEVLLVDCRMPQMDGTRFLRALNDKIPNLSTQTRIYGFSALGQQSSMAKELSAYVRGIIEKPTDIFEFVHLIRSLLNPPAV